MKTLNPTELVELLPPTPQQLEYGLAAFELTAPILCREPGYLKTLAAEGWLKTSIVRVNGVPGWLIGWHMTPDRGFWFDVVITLGESQAPYSTCVAAVERLAREQKARYIRWVTLRRGIVKWAQEQGYTPEAVILTKMLP